MTTNPSLGTTSGRSLTERRIREPLLGLERRSLHRELMVNEELLARAIAESERWYRRRERGLIEFDRRASARVAWLRAGGHVRASLTWNPGAAVRTVERQRATERAEPHRRAGRTSVLLRPVPSVP